MPRKRTRKAPEQGAGETKVTLRDNQTGREVTTTAAGLARAGKIVAGINHAKAAKALDAIEAAAPAGEITKIKWAGKEGEPVIVIYDLPKEHEKRSVTFQSNDPPKAAFDLALQALVRHAFALLEIQDEDWQSDIKVRSVSIRWEESRGMGATISCVKKLDCGAAFCFNTPYLAEAAENGPALPFTCADAIRKLIQEAVAYMNGKRAQGALPFKDSKAAASGEEEDGE